MNAKTLAALTLLAALVPLTKAQQLTSTSVSPPASDQQARILIQQANLGLTGGLPVTCPQFPRS